MLLQLPTQGNATEAAATPTEEAKALLNGLSKKHRNMRTMTGSFVQRVTTPLMRKPIVSRGTIAFRREPRSTKRRR